MSLVPRHRPRRARGVRLHLRRQGAFVLARRLLPPRLLPRRHHAVLHEGRAQDPPGPLRDQHHPSLPLVQELAREPVPVVRVSRPIPAVQRVHHSARGPPHVAPGHGLCFDGGVSDLQLLKGLARNGTFCKLHCRKTNPKNLVVVCPFYSSRADIRPSKYVPMWWAFFPPEPYKLKELFELGQKDAHTWADKQDETSPSGSPRSSAESDTSEDDEWEWRRREKAAAAAARTAPPRGRRRGDRRDPDPRWVRDGGDTARGTPNPRAVARREGARRSSRSLPRARR